MTPLQVSRADDSRLDPFRNIKGQSVRSDGTFVAESEIVLERLFDSNIVVRSILITPARAERLHEILASALAARPANEISVYVASQDDIDAVVGYPLHRGVIAVAERPRLPNVESILSTSRTIVVLENVMDPENVGSVFRHAAGFGVDGVILLGHTGDPLYRKTIRTSMGWTLSIPYARVSQGDASLSKRLEAFGFVTLALTPSVHAKSITEIVNALDDQTRVALLLGAEGPGLEASTLAAANYRVRIPMSAGVDSLNVATSAAVALFALTTAQPVRLQDR
jgi:tRNA G18 (ribose-2'-O)-methylase SpoU